MKNRHIERLRTLMRQFHRQNPWQLQQGLYIPHTYPLDTPDSWWDDVGFIHSGHRVMVWWIHPRGVYSDHIEQLALQEAGLFPEDQRTLAQVEKAAQFISRTSGRDVAYVGHVVTGRQRVYLDRVNEIEERLRIQGINVIVRPSMFVQYHPWGIGVSLCSPSAVRTLPELRALADLARRLLKRETTLKEMFPGYGYGRANWLMESGQVSKGTSY